MATIIGPFSRLPTRSITRLHYAKHFIATSQSRSLSKSTIRWNESGPSLTEILGEAAKKQDDIYVDETAREKDDTNMGKTGDETASSLLQGLEEPVGKVDEEPMPAFGGRKKDSSPSRRPQYSFGERTPGNAGADYLLALYCTPNNTLVTLAWLKPLPQPTKRAAFEHRVIVTESPAKCGYKKAQRGSLEAASAVCSKMVDHIVGLMDGKIPAPKGKQQKRKPSIPGPPAPAALHVRWRGFGSGRDTLYRTLMTEEAKPVKGLVATIGDTTPIPHGGVKHKKTRKV